MKCIFTLSFALSLTICYSQDDFFDILSPTTHQQDIYNDVESIEVTEYTPSYEEIGDTTVSLGNEDFPLDIMEEKIIHFENAYSSEIKVYAEEHELAYTEKVELNKEGFQILKDVRFEDVNLGEYLNENKKFIYDDKNRITKVKGSLPDGSEMEFLVLSYENDGTLKNGSMDAGMMKMQINRTDLKDTIRYSIEPDLEGMKELFGDMVNEMGKKNQDYYDLILDGNLGKYTFHLMSKDSVGNKKFLETIVRNKNFQITDKIYFDEGDIIVDHIKCSYAGDHLMTTSDLMSNIGYENKYDSEGKILKDYKWEQYVGFSKTEYKYDDHGNWTQSITTIDNEISTLTTRKITYR